MIVVNKKGDLTPAEQALVQDLKTVLTALNKLDATAKKMDIDLTVSTYYAPTNRFAFDLSRTVTELEVGIKIEK